MGELPGSEKGAFPAREGLGSPARAQARSFHHPSISLQGGHWELEIWAGLCTTGTGCCSTTSEQGSPDLPLHGQGNHSPCPTDMGEGDGTNRWGHAGGARPNPPGLPASPSVPGPGHHACSAPRCPLPPPALPGGPTGRGGLPPHQGLRYHPVVLQTQILVFPKGRYPPLTQGSVFLPAGPRFLPGTTGTRSRPRLPADPPDYFSWQMTTPSKLLNH